MRSIVFEPNALEDFGWWIAQDRKKALRILKLIGDIERSPFEGIGKPEPLRHELQGAWSRRIDQEHRLVYAVNDNSIRILTCRHHYES